MKKNRLIKSCIAFALLLSLLLPGCGAAKEDEAPEESPAGTLIGAPLAEKQAVDDLFSLNYAPDESVNPLSGGSSTNAILANLLYETLFSVNADYTFAPTRLINSYETTDGGRTWTFTVNTKVRFSDGSFLSADDAAYSIRCAMQGSIYRTRLDNYSVVYGISVLDDAQFIVTLHQENLLFPALLTIPILREGDYNTPCPVGTGLYKMQGAELWNDAAEKSDADPEDGAETPAPKPVEPLLVLNGLHPQSGSAAIREIHLQDTHGTENLITAFDDGLIDLVENDPTGISAMGYAGANEVRSYVCPSMYYIGFNVAHEFVMTAQYRYAMSFLVDRKTIVQKEMLGNGAAAVSPIVPTSPYYDDSIDRVVRYSPESALEQLARGGCADYDEDGKLEYMVTGIPMEIELDFIVCSSSTVKVSAARRIAEALREIGISVTLRELRWNEYMTALIDGDFDMYFGEVMLTADFNLSPLLTKYGSLNYGGVSDEGYASRIAAYLASDESRRAAACSDMCQYIVANSPIIPIAFETRDVVTHRGALSGIELSPYNIFGNIADWKYR